MGRELRFGMPAAVGYGGRVTVTLLDEGDEVMLTWLPDHRHYIRREKNEEYKSFIERVVKYADKHT